MKRKLITTSLALLLIMAAGQPLPAEDFRRWEPDDGIPLRAGYHIEWFRGIEGRDAGDFAGEVGIVWSDCRWTDTELGDRAVWLQIVGTDGEFRFEGEGKRIVDTENRQEDPGIWPSRSDGAWFIAWEDFDADSLGDIYCVKVDRNGNRLWAQNEPIGVPVCVFRGIQEGVRIVEDRDGGCIIAWKDTRNGDEGDLYAMHILADGTPDPDWDENGMIIVAEPGPQTNHTADSDGDGGMIIGWRDGRIVGNLDVWAQRINEDGELLWGNNEGIKVCGADGNQESPKLCPDGANGAFISWVDERNREQTGPDIWAQRINESGEVMWAENGVVVCEAEREQKGNRIVASFAGEAIVTWNDKREDNLTTDIFSMRISGEDRMIKHWNPSTGVPVSAVDSSNQGAVRLYPDGQGGAYYVWEDERNHGVPLIEIWAQRINRQGGNVWDEDGIPVCQTEVNNNAAAVRRTADGGAFFIWGRGPTGALGIFAQRKRPNGDDVWEENGVIVVQGISGNGRYAASINRSSNSFITVWSDGRFSDRGALPFIQFVENDNNGGFHPLLDEGGIPVLVGTDGGGVNQVVTTDGNEGAIVAWEDHRRGVLYAVYAQRVNSNGQLLWGDGGQKLAEYQNEQTLPDICEDGDGGAFIAWKSSSEDNYYNIFMQHVNSNGETLWGEGGLRVTNHEMSDLIVEMVYDDDGGLFLLYSADNDDTEDDLWAVRIDGDGNFLWGDDGGNGIVVCDDWGKQRNARMVRHRAVDADRAGVAIVWVDGRWTIPGEANNDIYAQVLDIDGEALLEENGSFIAFGEYHEDYPDLAIDNRTNVWIVWENFRWVGGGSRGRDISVRRIRPELNEQGRLEIIWDNLDGKLVCRADGDQLQPRIMHDGSNGMWITWKDHRDGIWTDIFSTHLRQNGNPYDGWDEDGNPVTQAFHKQEEPHHVALTSLGETGASVVWVDKRATGKEELFNIYTQRLDDDVVSVPQKPRRNVPLSFNLGDVYPNPFNSKALVNFSLGREGTIKLELYDISGRLVADVASGWWSAGIHHTVLDGSELATGTYIMKLEFDDLSIERKVQFIK